MSCAPFDWKDYVFGELPPAERRRMEEHAADCAPCQTELERLRITGTALMTVREEEVPRRIAFVSDKVFEPRWWRTIWQSGPRLGFASAAMLSAAILVHAYTRPATQAAPPPAIDQAQIERRIQEKVTEQVAQAVAAAEAKQQVRVAEAVADAEKRHTMERREMELAVDAKLEYLQKHLNSMVLASSRYRGGE